MNGALLDELLLVTGIAPLLETQQLAGGTLRKKRPTLRMYRFVSLPAALPHHTGDLARLVRLAEEKGEHVRLDWKGEEPPSNMHDGRAAVAPLALKLNWAALFSHRFFKNKHINLMELESLISLLRRVTLEGVQARRLLVLVDSRVERDDRAHEKSTSFFENWCFGASLVTSR